MNKFLTPPQDHLFSLKAKVNSLQLKLKGIDHALDSNMKTLYDVLDHLPFLEPDIRQLEIQFLPLQQSAQQLCKQSETQQRIIECELEKLTLCQQQISENETSFASLKKEQKKLQQAFGYFKVKLDLKGDFELLKIASKDPNLGIGMSHIEDVAAPLLDDQIYSIENALTKNEVEKKSLLAMQQSLYSQSFEACSQIKSSCEHMETSIHRLDEQTIDLVSSIINLKCLSDLASQPTLHGAVIRNNVEDTLSFIANGVSANVEIDGKKPIYYACRLGHLDLATKLIDYTYLSQREQKELLEVFPKTNVQKYNQMKSALFNNNTYDYIWDDRISLGDNLQKMFEDYYSPSLLQRFSLSDVTKRTLTLNWNRQYVNEAENLAGTFSKLFPDLKNDNDFCKKIIESNLSHCLDKNLDNQDTFVKRLEYAKGKCDKAATVKQLASVISKFSIYANDVNKTALKSEPVTSIMSGLKV